MKITDESITFTQDGKKLKITQWGARGEEIFIYPIDKLLQIIKLLEDA